MTQKINVRFDDIRLRSSLTTNETVLTVLFTEICFHTLLGFTQNPSGRIGDSEGVVRKIPGIYKDEKTLTLLETMKFYQYVMQSDLVR